MRIALLTALCLAFFSIALPGAAMEIDGVIIGRIDRPDPEDTPTIVTMSVYIIDIMEIDDVKGTLKMDYFLRQTWKDHRLADKNFPNPEKKLNLTINDIWNPHLEQINIVESIEKSTALEIDAEGNVVYRRRLTDTFRTPLNLRDFPFDKQVFDLEFISTGYLSEQVDIIWDEGRFGWMEDFSLTGWEFEGIEIFTNWTPVRIGEFSGGNLEGIDMRLTLSRRSAFYIWKVFIPLGLIFFMAWTVFLIDPAEFGGQAAISTSSVITLIAFQLSLSDLMPRISYLTKIDIFSLGTSILVFLSLGEAILTARLAKIEKHELSLTIDRWMRGLFPLAYLALILLVFL